MIVCDLYVFINPMLHLCRKTIKQTNKQKTRRTVTKTKLQPECGQVMSGAAHFSEVSLYL